MFCHPELHPGLTYALRNAKSPIDRSGKGPDPAVNYALRNAKSPQTQDASVFLVSADE